MATNDADMPNQRALGEDIQEIAEHLARLRKDLDNLVGSIGRTGTHQADHLREQADHLREQVTDALGAVGNAVKRDPLTSLAIALGIGFLLGILLRR